MGAATGEEMGGYVSDSEAFASLIHVLDSVRMEPNLVASDDKEQYNYLLSIVNPNSKFGPDEEALLATALKALSRAVSKIDAIYHASLLSNIFAMRIWFLGNDAREALLELIITLAAVPDKYLDGCFHMLVTNFMPPDRIALSFEGQRWNIRKKEIHADLQLALRYISDLVPLAPLKLQFVIDKAMPRCFEPKHRIIAFVECMLGLVSEEIGETLGSTLLAKVVDLFNELDVNVSWDDILQEDQNKGIFDMEIEDIDEFSSHFFDDPSKVNDGNKNGVSKANNLFVEKLDSVMVIMCEHLKSRAENGYLLKDFGMLMDIFNRSILKLHKSKFTQFVMFYACSLDPEICGLNFAVRLADIFISKSEDPISRMSAISYLGSYLARAKFISPSIITSILRRIVEWCFDYCRLQNVQQRFFNPKNHRIFYSACQAVMYILCFRMRALIEVPHLKSILLNLPLGFIFCHPLDPLKVCLPSIVEEFMRQAKEASLFHASVPTIYENALDSELSRAFGGPNRLDLFFPFDPYLLKESDRFIRPNFEYWSRVKTSSSNFNAEEEGEEIEEEFLDNDAPKMMNNKEDFNVDYINNNDENNSDNEEEEEMGFNLDKMSITPQQRTFHFPTNKQMPTRIRVSASPPL
ncbi:hypothetical protein LUZ60_008655 [Juncus effusus]|nr:hypothetical protein LUZ60_008655 [Juncus effusus]